MNIQETIFEAIEIIADKKINEIKFDKTIDAIVVSDTNAEKGEYEVKYQDVTFKAYSNNNTIKYRENDNVFVFIPQGDFSYKKSIIGKKDMNGEEFIDVEDIYDKIEKIGGNFVEPENTVLRLLAGASSKKEIPLRKQDMINEYPNKTNLLISAVVNSNLINEIGDFGIKLTVIFEGSIEHTYKMSMIDMTGNPYRLNGAVQNKIFSLSLNKLVDIKDCSFYIEGFESSNEGYVEIKSIEVQYIKPREAENLTQFTAELIANKGTVFKNGVINADQTLELTMVQKKLEKEFKPNSIFKWFYMDSTVDSEDANNGWDADGGLGWRLVDFQLTRGLLEEKDNGKTIVIYADFVPNFEVFKCVAIFGGEKVELPEGESIEYGVVKVKAQETIVDQTDAMNITITSSEGDVFKSDSNITSTILSCGVFFGVEKIPSDKFLYTWIKIDDNKNPITISSLQESENLTVDIKSDIIETRNYICEVYIK